MSRTSWNTQTFNTKNKKSMTWDILFFVRENFIKIQNYIIKYNNKQNYNYIVKLYMLYYNKCDNTIITIIL